QQSVAPLLPVVVPDGQQAAAAGAGAVMHLPQRQQQVVVGQQVRDGVVARDHHVELTPVGGVGRPHVADGEVDVKGPAPGLGAGPGDGAGGQVGGGDSEAPPGQAEGLGADPAGDIQNGPRTASPAVLNDAGKLSGLALDALGPVREDQVVKAGHPVVE